MNPSVTDDKHSLSSERFDIFRRAASVLTSSLQLEQALANTISVCLPGVGDFGFFDVILDDGVRRTARAHLDPELESLLNTTSWSDYERTDINLCALTSGDAVLHANTDDAWFARAFNNTPRWLAFRSMLSVPVRYGNELIGSLTLFMSTSGRQHSEDDLQFVAELAGLAAPVVMNARLLEQQRNSQAALRDSEERLRLATNAGKIGIWDWDIINNKVNWSERVYELHGLALDEFGGRAQDFTALLHPDDREPAWQKIQSAINTEDFFTNEFRAIRPDGAIAWMATWANVYRDANGKAVRMVGSTIDITARKKRELGLCDLNAALKERVVSSTSDRDRIWRMSKDILAVASMNGYFVSLSPAFTAVLGWEEREVLPNPFLNLAHPNQRDDLQNRLIFLANGIPQEEVEVQCLHKDGSYRWISWTIVSEGQLMYGVGRDITELRRQREQILNATERRLQLALNVGGMGAWQWDLRTDNIIWWPGMDTIHGLAPGTGIAQVHDYLHLIHPGDRERVAKTFENYPGKPANTTEYRILWPDGSVHWIEGRGELFSDEHGQPISVAGVCVDITCRKLTEQNLRFLAKASAELAELIDHEDTLNKIAHLSVPEFADWCSVDMLDEQGKLQRVAVAHIDPEKINLAHELHKQYPPDLEYGHGSWEVIRSGKTVLVPEITHEMLEASIKDQQYVTILKELGLHSYIGAPLNIRGKTRGVLTFISAEGRRTYGANDVSLVEDISSRAAIAIENSMLYRSLKDADRRKDDFLAMLAHELRNPLAPIKVAADLLTLPLDSERLANTSKIISRQVDHMTGLVDDLLDVSRVTQGRVIIEKNPVNITQVINAAIEQVRPLIDKHHHHLTVALGAGRLFVEGDEKRLVQVIANLLNNSAKYTPDNGSITLQVKAVQKAIEITISDNGIGMTADLMLSAFDLFVQGQRAADRSEGGLGLGLALVKSLTELHGGNAQAHSDGPGRGSKFTLRFPALPAPAQPDTEASVNVIAKAQHALRILMVDDNIDAAQMLALFLQMLGHNAEVVHTPSGALDKVQSNTYDVLLLDIGLPDMDGNELARQIRARLGDRTPVMVAITGYGREQDRETARAAGIEHYIVKPVDTGELLQLLNEIQARVQN